MKGIRTPRAKRGIENSFARRGACGLLVQALIVCGFSAARAEIDFAISSTSQVPVATIQGIAGAASTSALDGVALAPSRDLYVLHRDNASNETVVRLNPAAGIGVPIGTSSSIAADLGAGYTAAMIFEAGFASSPDRQVLYFGDSSHASFEITVGRIRANLPGAPASVVLRSPDLDDTSDFAVLPTGEIVAVRGGAGVGIVDPDAGVPVWTQVLDEADFQAVLGVAGPVPPETLAVHPVLGDVYVFCHDELELFRVRDIRTVPLVARVLVPGWNGTVDLHDLAVDEDGNVYGFDEAAERIVVWDGTAAHEWALDDIAEDLAGPSAPPFEVALWRGMAVRKIDSCRSELFLASATPDYGLVRLVFGQPAPVDFTTVSATEIPVSAIESILGAPGSTDALDGVTFGPDDDLLVLHRDPAANETVVRIDPATHAGAAIKTAAQIASDLGAGYTSAMIFEAGFEFDRPRGFLYFADSSHASFELTLGRIDLSSAGSPASVVHRGIDLDDMSDFALGAGGVVLGTRGLEGFGIVDPRSPSPAWIEQVPMSELQALLGVGGDVPPESVGSHPLDGDATIFAHDELQTFAVADPGGDAVVSLVSPPGWSGVVDLHDIVADQDGNLYGFDEAGERIAIFDGSASHFLDLDDIAQMLRGPSAPPLEVTLWRGTAVRIRDCGTAELFLASATSDYGIVKLVFGTGFLNSALNWEAYD